MPSDFYLAAIPEPVTLLGLRLRPFSLGHVLLLHRVESAYVTGGVPTYEDLALSVFICSQKYVDALAAFDDPALPRFMRAWHDRLAGVRWFTPWRKPRVIDITEKSAAFGEYIRAGSKVPYYAFNPSDAADSQTEAVQSVKVMLLSRLNVSESELMDRPWGLCLWDYVTIQAMDGKLRMYDEDGKSSIQQAKEFAEKLAANLKANGTT